MRRKTILASGSLASAALLSVVAFTQFFQSGDSNSFDTPGLNSSSLEPDPRINALLTRARNSNSEVAVLQPDEDSTMIAPQALSVDSQRLLEQVQDSTAIVMLRLGALRSLEVSGEAPALNRLAQLVLSPERPDWLNDDLLEANIYAALTRAGIKSREDSRLAALNIRATR